MKFDYLTVNRQVSVRIRLRPPTWAYGVMAALKTSKFYNISNIFYGWLVQWLERFVYTEEVGGSNPSPPTHLSKRYALIE